MAPPSRRPIAPAINAADLHRQWLELVDIEGPFLAIPPLKRVWPNGMPDFRSTHPDRFSVLREARKTFEPAWEALDRAPDTESVLEAYRITRDKWVETVLRDVIGWGETLQWGVSGVQAQSPSRVVSVTAQGALVGADGIGALVHVVDATDSLRQVPSDLWAATPVDRLEALLRENEVELGIVTDGRWWGLVHACEGSMAASGIVDALTWVEEPRARDAFLSLVGRRQIIGGDPGERLPILFRDSVAAAEEITEALGAQVRRAVELLIQSFSESAADAKRRGLPDPLPARTHETYEAAVTVMMRAVFLLFAEERGLLPTGELFEQGYGISRELSRLAARESEETEEALDSTSLTWHRLLATSRALFGGATFESLRMPAYGGSLFDPARFPFLSAITDQGTLAVTVSDRVMLHVLRSVQIAVVQGDARQISFRDIDVEQIGYIYEGLLGYTCAFVDQTYLGIIGSTGAEPEIPLAKLDELAAANADPKQLATAIREWISADQPSAKPSSIAAITKAIKVEAEPSAISALAQVVADDPELCDRITPWLGLVRRDLREHPFVVLAGGLLVKETPSRKNAGAHYTPKSLAEEVVLHALQPLCYSPGPHQTADDESWRLKSSDELLDLKVADIACGSGAFLVAAARYLAERIVEAWISEDPTNAQRNDLYLRAVRQVVANCLYGADINDLAVEMCKLSLWLVSLDSDLPFSFVDDKIFVGNSLLGLTSLDQIRKLHIDPKRAPVDRRFDIFDVNIDAIIRKAVDLRLRLATEIDDDDPARSAAAKHRQLNELGLVTAELRHVADGIVAAGLPLGGKPGKALDEAYEGLRLAIKQAHPSPTDSVANSAWLDGIVQRGLTPTVETDYRLWQPLHWVLEAPDVLVERGGFDSIVGNPPFLGFKKITPAVGENVRTWYADVLAGGRVANADLVSFFLNRGRELLGPSGSMGMIATSTVSEGDTRSAGLDRLVQSGFEITRCVKGADWPVSSVSIQYSVFWGGLNVATNALRVVDKQIVSQISTTLEAVGRVSGNPLRLIENKNLGYQGCIPLGDGFVLSEDEAQAMIRDDAQNQSVIFPFLNGDDLNSSPTHQARRWVIDFDDRDEAAARRYVLPFERLEKLVKPVRAKNNRKVRRERWWQFAERQPAMRAAIAERDEILVITVVSKNVMPVRIETGPVISNGIDVFATASYPLQAVLSSSIHNVWAVARGSTLGAASNIRYTLSDIFETFPRPRDTPRLEAMGQLLHTERAALMLRRQLGLTKLYAMVHASHIADESDNDVARVREIHVELDDAVVEAYGWSDIGLDHGFHTYGQMERWTVSPAARVEILDRLLEENHRRAAAEAAQAKSRGKGRKSKAGADGTETLFS